MRYTLWFFTESVLRSATYVWAKEYESAVLELDSEKLMAKIGEAEIAIQQRKAELLQKTPVPADELAAMVRASRALNVLKEITQRHQSLASIRHG